MDLFVETKIQNSFYPNNIIFDNESRACGDRVFRPKSKVSLRTPTTYYLILKCNNTLFGKRKRVHVYFHVGSEDSRDARGKKVSANKFTKTNSSKYCNRLSSPSPVFTGGKRRFQRFRGDRLSVDFRGGRMLRSGRRASRSRRNSVKKKKK